jgi:YgiT-type zinc finger domain-containing protein
MKKSKLSSETTCPMCGQGKTHIMKIDYKLKDENGKTFTVPELNVEVCDFCGEQIFNMDAVRKARKAQGATNKLLMNKTLQATPIVPGEAQGRLLLSTEPLSFWGGYDPLTGEIIDRRHPLSGKIASGCVLALPFTRGSSTTTAVLLEAVRRDKAPAAILTTKPDQFLALASIVADEMYRKPIPVAVLEKSSFTDLATGIRVQLHLNGAIEQWHDELSE